MVQEVSFKGFTDDEITVYLDWMFLIDKPWDDGWVKRAKAIRVEYQAIKRKEIEDKTKEKE